jgi:hypothetical protein
MEGEGDSIPTQNMDMLCYTTSSSFWLPWRWNVGKLLESRKSNELPSGFPRVSPVLALAAAVKLSLGLRRIVSAE